MLDVHIDFASELEDALIFTFSFCEFVHNLECLIIVLMDVQVKGQMIKRTQIELVLFIISQKVKSLGKFIYRHFIFSFLIGQTFPIEYL